MNCLGYDQQMVFQSFHFLHHQVSDTSKNYDILAQKSQRRYQQTAARFQKENFIVMQPFLYLWPMAALQLHLKG